MRRLLSILCVVTLAACGSGDGDPVQAMEQALIDDGLSEEEAACMAPDLVELGYSASDIADLDSEPSDEAMEVVLGCLSENLLLDMIGDLSDSLDEPEAQSYGDDPELDALYDACGSGDLMACDDLYMEAPFGSEYEEFGLDCGGNEGESALFCSESSRP